MKVVRPEEISTSSVEMNGAKVDGATIRWLIKDSDGAKNFAMRYFELKKDAVIPIHTHPWEHEVFVLEGKVLITEGDESTEAGPNTAIFVRPDQPHSYKNIGEGRLKFLCLIPYKGG